jgi:hypothetical protein
MRDREKIELQSSFNNYGLFSFEQRTAENTKLVLEVLLDIRDLLNKK